MLRGIEMGEEPTRRELPSSLLARQVCELLPADACSVYEYWRAEEYFLLSGCSGWELTPDRRQPRFTARESDHLKDGVWTGLTAFVARTRRPLRCDRVEDLLYGDLDDVRVRLQRTAHPCELAKTGPALIVPVIARDAVVGVIRAVRHRDAPVFTENEERLLQALSPIVANHFIEGSFRTDLIRGLFDDITMEPSESAMLEKVANWAVRLVRGNPENTAGAAIYRYDRSDRKYHFCAPTKNSKACRATYRPDERRLTSWVLRERSPLFSNNLPLDLRAGERLADVGHEPEAQETPGGSTKSIVIMPIPSVADGQPLEGVIRVASEEFNAFSSEDVESLVALAHQTGLLLEMRRQFRERQQLIDALTNASERPIVAVGRHGVIREFNLAACKILNVQQPDDVRDKPVHDVVYGGRKELAREVQRKLKESVDGRIRRHYTTFFTLPRGELRAIPIPVRLEASQIRDSKGAVVGSVGIFEEVCAEGPLRTVYAFKTQIGTALTSDERIAETFREISKMAPRLHGAEPQANCPVLIIAETGTGKEFLAREIHASTRSKGPFVAINCATLGSATLVTELFGVARSAKGMYTGAEAREGLLEQAAGGTVFFDEIADLSREHQAQLLRALERGIRRVGDRDERAIDLQFVAATNKDLAALGDDVFRRDLLARIRGLEYTLPPLRERPMDIMLLAHQFISEQKDVRLEGFSSEAIEVFMNYDWPENVRELQRTVVSAAARWIGKHGTGTEHGLITVEHLPLHVLKNARLRDAQPRTSARAVEAVGEWTSSGLSAMERRVAKLEQAVLTLQHRPTGHVDARTAVNQVLSTATELADRVRAAPKISEVLVTEVQALCTALGATDGYTSVYTAIREWRDSGHGRPLRIE